MGFIPSITPRLFKTERCPFNFFKCGKGFSLIDVLQPCVTFNKENSYQWYSKRVYKLDKEAEYDPGNKASAYIKAAEWGDRIPLGVIYRCETKTYEEKSGLDKMAPLVDNDIGNIDINGMMKDFI